MALMGALTPAAAGEATPTTADLSGRWNGELYGAAKAARACGDDSCALTVDISRCGTDWCGVRVEDGKCVPGIALKLTPEVTTPDGEAFVVEEFSGKLEIAQNTQPYVVKAHWREPLASEPGAVPQLELGGATNGKLMVMRFFPLNTVLARTGDAACKSDNPAS
jgi:hypothetical protein